MAVEVESTVIKEHLEKVDEKLHSLSDTVKEHIAMDKQYYKEIEQEKEDSMTDNSALIAALMSNKGGTGGEGAALGMGGGLLGGVLLGSLLSRNGGLFGGGDGNGAGLGIQAAVDTSSITEMLGDIKAAVPLAESQVQLALAGTQASLTGQINDNTLATLTGQAAINKNISEAIAASLASQNSINMNVLQSSTANLMATKDAQYAVSAAIVADGEKTRALITENTIAQLNRLAAERQDEIIELRNSAARDNDRHGIEINMINNQNQNQLQFQQQAQVLNTLASALVEVGQVARATNQNLIVGNAGAVATGPQTANPVNVRA